MSCRYGAAGVVVWGWDGDGATSARCEALVRYINTTFGPTVQRAVEEFGACAVRRFWARFSLF